MRDAGEWTGKETDEGAGGLINMTLNFNTRYQQQVRLRNQLTWESETKPLNIMQLIMVTASVMMCTPSCIRRDEEVQMILPEFRMETKPQTEI